MAPLITLYSFSISWTQDNSSNSDSYSEVLKGEGCLAMHVMNKNPNDDSFWSYKYDIIAKRFFDFSTDMSDSDSN